MSEFVKDPNASGIPFVVDARAYLEEHSRLIGETDTLSAATATIVDATDAEDGGAALTIDATEFTPAGLVRVWTSAGTAGESYRIRVRITGTVTSPAQLQDDRTFVVNVSHQ